MKNINSVLRLHRKPAKPEFYQLIVVTFTLQLIKNRLIVNIPGGNTTYRLFST